MTRFPFRNASPRRPIRLCLLVAGIASGLGVGSPGFDFFDSSRLLMGETSSGEEVIEKGTKDEKPYDEDSEKSGTSSGLEGTAGRLNLSGRKLREKQRQVQAVVLLFMGIVILGVLMFAALLLYGSWIRRMNRGRAPPTDLAAELERIRNVARELPPGSRSQEGRRSDEETDFHFPSSESQSH